MQIKINLIIAMVGCVFFGHSQLPANWNVNPNDYNYSMTLTGKIQENCNILSDNSNAIGAFVGGQCRGFAYTTIDASGSKLSFMQIYSNSASGDVVEIRFYNQAFTTETISIDGANFLSNATLGTISNPFIATNNHRPTDLNLSNTTMQEGTLIGGFTGTISASDIDVSQTLTYSLVPGELENSSFTVSGNTLNLNTVLNYNVQTSYQISLEVNDGFGCSLVDTFTLNVDDNAFPPIAVNDTLTGTEDTQLDMIVLANDTDYDNDLDSSSVLVIQNPVHGTFTITADGIIQYIPDLDYFGLDSLVYSVCDLTNTGSLCDTAFVLITILPVDDAPIANTDNIVTDEDVSITFDVSLNDTDVENNINPASVQIVTSTVNGTATVNAAGLITYISNPFFNGLDSLTYSICDFSTPTPLCDMGTVYITVYQVANEPTDILMDTLTVLEDNQIHTLIDGLESIDNDLPADNFTYELVAGTGDSDNTQFSIVDNQVWIETKTNYDIKQNYNIRIRTTDSFGLSFEKTFVVQVIDIVGNDLPLPATTFISNNADGKNDYFAIDNVVIYDYFGLKIFDQFGQIVFEKANAYNNEFDGMHNGDKLPTGTYYYIFSSDAKKYQGYITIIN